MQSAVKDFSVSDHPYAEWAAQQIIDAFPYEEAPRFLLRDRNGIYGDCFKTRVTNIGIEEALIASRSPLQNPFCERLVESIRRDCLDHVIVLNEEHLRRILKSYFQYYHEARAHLSRDRNTPIPREVEPGACGKVISLPQVGGLHHRCARAA